jgi:hypothetical protein
MSPWLRAAVKGTFVYWPKGCIFRRYSNPTLFGKGRSEANAVNALFFLFAQIVLSACTPMAAKAASGICVVWNNVRIETAIS